MTTTRTCRREGCDNPLPEELPHGASRKYCDECRRILKNERCNEANKRARYRKHHPGRRRDPMLCLGMDFVALKIKYIGAS
jgi:hypothetical protein